MLTYEGQCLLVSESGWLDGRRMRPEMRRKGTMDGPHLLDAIWSWGPGLSVPADKAKINSG